MDEKKGFFELLEPKSALAVGVLGGFLTLCTIGFFVLGSMVLRGNYQSLRSSQAAATPSTPATVVSQQAPTPPPNVPKSDKPKVELFVMSYCPYGLQMEKAYLPAMNLLKNKADIDIKFVSYAMHGLKEVEENTRQYCIETQQNAKYDAYLKCFVASSADPSGKNGENNYTTCLTEAGVNIGKLNTCVAQTNKQYNIMGLYNDQTKWLSGRFPQYPIHETLNQQYGVQGSPTLVINGVQAEVARTPEAVKQAICNAFNSAPSECSQALATVGYQPGFGMQTDAGTGGAVAPGCGT